ncbi:MAG: ATP-binding cassette domain-containing protein [Nitrososphaerota archaeon]|nr:ATP-binding cassette domain-containing protein [Nitrososphaerota archaeon]
MESYRPESPRRAQSREKAAVVGPNGSGKSTLFRAVLGLVRIQSGSAKVFGTSIGQERGDVRVLGESAKEKAPAQDDKS